MANQNTSPKALDEQAAALASPKAKAGKKTSPKGGKKESPKEAPKPKKELGKTEMAILETLAKRGRLTRNGIAEKAGYSNSVAVYQQVGWPDEAKRREWEAEHDRKTLLTRGFVREHEVDVDGKKETLVELTAAGRKALERSK